MKLSVNSTKMQYFDIGFNDKITLKFITFTFTLISDGSTSSRYKYWVILQFWSFNHKLTSRPHQPSYIDSIMRQQYLLVIASLMVMMCQADLDVEDFIAQGYSCSLADPNVQNFKPGVEIVCDDGICSQCIKIGEPVDGRNLGFFKPTTHLDVEDLIAQGYTCSLADSKVQNFRPGFEVVCDDGVCSQCIRNPRLRRRI